MWNALITGGAGFIGSNFVHYLLKQPQYSRVLVLDSLTYAGNLENLKEAEKDPKFKFILGSICDRALIQQIFSQQEIHHVFHFAAESHVDRSISNPLVFLETNVIGTAVLLESARQAWGNKFDTYRFLHVSTDEVYGSLGATGLFTEETPFAPNSPYSASKAGSDHLVRAYHHTFSLPTLTTNCSNNYGPWQFPEKLIPLLIHNILNKKPLPIYGDGKNVRDWLYVLDHCKAILRVMQRGKLGETYNIGGHNEWTNMDIVHLVCDLMDEKLSLKGADSARNLITFVKDRAGHDRRYAIDASKIKSSLDWVPEETFESGIRKTINWYLDHQGWIQQVTSGAYREYYNTQYAQRGLEKK